MPKKCLSAAILLMFTSTAFAGFEYVNTKVSRVGSSWETNFACVHLQSGHVIKLDITTDRGVAELSIALAAKASNSSVRVTLENNGVLSGGCDTGVNIRRHGYISIIET
jgi:hypothetical protein